MVPMFMLALLPFFTGEATYGECARRLLSRFFDFPELVLDFRLLFVWPEFVTPKFGEWTQAGTLVLRSTLESVWSERTALTITPAAAPPKPPPPARPPRSPAQQPGCSRSRASCSSSST